MIIENATISRQCPNHYNEITASSLIIVLCWFYYTANLLAMSVLENDAELFIVSDNRSLQTWNTQTFSCLHLKFLRAVALFFVNMQLTNAKWMLFWGVGRQCLLRCDTLYGKTVTDWLCSFIYCCCLNPLNTLKSVFQKMALAKNEMASELNPCG